PPSPKPTPRRTPAPTPTSAQSATHTIHMQAPYRFAPRTLTVPVGDRVRVVNDDAAHHTFTAAGVFDSGDMAQHATYTYRFTKAGRFDFVCRYHSSLGMTGSITVR
ncbi:MAG: cupredoxin domain-containing protein, partial [Mycobacteriales bacterium]